MFCRVEEQTPLAVFLMGPTGSRKTEVAVDLVQHLPCDIISVDSAQVFRGMDIGTAKPSKEVQSIAPHRLIDIRDPSESYSAGQFRLDALREMEATVRAGRIPLLVGGTMLYFRALRQGLASLPEAHPEVRLRLNEQASRIGWPAMHGWLNSLDPDAALRIHPNDSQRIQRALEVYQVTGRTLTELLVASTDKTLPYRVLRMILAPARRPILSEWLGERFRQMLARGLVGEVETLRSQGNLGLHLPAMRSVGYRQVWQYLEGKVEYSAMVERAIIATRQLAKRQLTWLRVEPGATWLDSLDPRVAARARDLIERSEAGPTAAYGRRDDNPVK